MSYKYRVVEISKENGSTTFELQQAESEIKYTCLDGCNTQFTINNEDLIWECVDVFDCIGNAIDRAKYLKGQHVKSEKVVWSDIG